MPVDVQTYFEQRAKERTWASLYEGPLDARSYNFFTRREAVARLLDAEGTFPRVLDVGCGTGDYAELAFRHGGEYFGVDFSSAMIAQARQRFEGRGAPCRFLVGAGEALPYRDNSFDLVLAIGYLEYFRDPIAPLQEIRRVLKPGGVLVIQSYKRELCGTVYRFLLHPLRLVWLRARGKPAGWGPPMGIDRPYSQRRLDRLLGACGFARTGHAFNHFAVLPDPFRSRAPRLYIRCSEAIGRRSSAWWRLLAVNYIGKYTVSKAA